MASGSMVNNYHSTTIQTINTRPRAVPRGHGHHAHFSPRGQDPQSSTSPSMATTATIDINATPLGTILPSCAPTIQTKRTIVAWRAALKTIASTFASAAGTYTIFFFKENLGGGAPFGKELWANNFSTLCALIAEPMEPTLLLFDVSTTILFALEDPRGRPLGLFYRTR